MHFGAQNHDENETECSISLKPSSLSTKEQSHSLLKSCNTWTKPTSEIQRDLAEVADRSDRRIFVEKYNILASKHGVRLMFSYTFKSSTDNLRVIPARRHSWFSRKILRRQYSYENVRDKGDRYLRHKRSFSELSLKFRSRKDKLKGKNLQELGRLCGVSLLYLPSEFTAGNLFIPTCFRAMAQYLVQYETGTTTNGIFRISGSQDSVDDLYNYFCYPNERSEVVSGTVRSPTLPDHIKYDVYDVASAFKKLLTGLPGGILGSLSLFDAFISIKTQLDGDFETTDSELRSVRARLFALAILTSSSQYRRSLICAVFGLLCMIGDAAESIKRGDNKGRPLLKSDLMGYGQLGVIFGPILTGDLLEDYTMRLASPSEGIVLLPMSPTKSRKERKVCSTKSCHNPKAYSEIDKSHISNSIIEMLITQWRDIVKHLKDLSSLDNSECIQKSDSFHRKYTKLRPRISKNYTLKGEPERNTTGTVTPEESESNDDATFVKKRKNSNSSSKQGLLASKSMSILSPTFEEEQIQKVHSLLQKKSRDLQPSNSPSVSLQKNNEGIELKYHHRISELEKLTHLDNKCKPKYPKITPTSQVLVEKTRGTRSPSNCLSEGTEPQTRSDDKVRKTISTSKSLTQIENILSSSSISSTKVSLLKMNSWNEENNNKRELPRSPHKESSMNPHAISPSLIEAYPQKSHDIVRGNLDIKTLAKNFGSQITPYLPYDESNLNSDFAQISNHSANNFKSRLNHEFLAPSRSLVKVTDSCFDYMKSATVKEFPNINQAGPTVTTSQNEKKVLTKSLNLTSKINDKISFSNPNYRSTSRRSDKISGLLAKFENNVCGSSALLKTSNSLNTRRNSALSRDRPLSVYTQNSPSPTKSRMSIKSGMKSQNTLGSFSIHDSPIINPEISHNNSYKSERYLYEPAIEKRQVSEPNKAEKIIPPLITISDATLSPSRSVKSSIEILNASTPKSFLNFTRSLSETRLLDRKDLSSPLTSPNNGKKYSQNLKQPLNLQNKLNFNMHPRLRKRLKKNSLLSYQSQDSLAESLAGSFNHDTEFSKRNSDPCQTNVVPITAPCSSNHMLFDQVRNLQRKLDKKNQEVYKLKQNLGTQEDILTGSMTQELLNSKKLVQYWQERAEFFEKNLHLLSQTLLENEPSPNFQKPTKFSHKDEVPLKHSDMNGFKTTEVAHRSLTPYLVDSYSRTRSQSGYSGRTVIRNS
ncbi:hypothetical protein GcM3_045012 [Golovinomyces cichoracearum]|uniref:Rho-GAP domain-containing protein n=1 Tax=Golovinomyces cichoracearum TaxID=62708 RepID=A0A420J0Z1_9PEZI|nr:hypothetical protein GcM3_045012 [Golovinomyces cichoracearum]